MPNITNTTIDYGCLVIGESAFRDELLTFAGADDLLEGTILARDTSTLKLRLYVKGGVTAGNGIPCAVLTYPLSVAGAGDVPVRVLIAGQVNQSRLVIDADANASNIDGTVADLLRAKGIIPQNVTQLD